MELIWLRVRYGQIYLGIFKLPDIVVFAKDLWLQIKVEI